MPPSTRTKKKRPLLTVSILILVLALVGIGWFAFRWLAARNQVVLPMDSRCTATVNQTTVTITPEQANMAAIIVAESQRRHLVPRAASIALATAYQESGIRNLDYGDRDSVGLFQQRPSQGWGAVEQLLDPWYSSGKFYEALVKVSNWQNGDLNDVAQKVQISGHPEAYRKHVPNARALASALTGETPAAFGCHLVLHDTKAPEPEVAAALITTAFDGRVKLSRQGNSLTLTGPQPELWSAAQLSIAYSSVTGLRSVTLGKASWTSESTTWKGSPEMAKTATLSFTP